MYSVVKVSCH